MRFVTPGRPAPCDSACTPLTKYAVSLCPPIRDSSGTLRSTRSPNPAGFNAVLKAEQEEVRQRRHWSHMMARSLADCVAFGHAGVAMGQDADSLAS